MLIETQDVVVTNYLSEGPGFGVTEEGEQVFITPELACELHVGDQVEAILVPNTWKHKERTPWRMIKYTNLRVINAINKLFAEEAPEPEPPKPSLRQRVLDVLEEDPESQWTVNDIKDLLGMDVGHQDILQECDGLWAVGSIVKAQVYGGYNKVATFNLYAKDIEAFK